MDTGRHAQVEGVEELLAQASWLSALARHLVADAGVAEDLVSPRVLRAARRSC
jgi:hypothetical protein